MSHILFVMLWGVNNVYPITTAEFNTMEHCQYAIKVLKERSRKVEGAFCLEKGLKK
jgi:hypothetical protein